MKKPLIPPDINIIFQKFVLFLKQNRYILLFSIPFILSLVVFFSADSMFLAALAAFILSFTALFFWNFTKNLLGGVAAALGTLGLIIFLFALVIFLVVRSNNGNIHDLFNVFEIIEQMMNL